MSRYWFSYNPGGGSETNPAAYTKLNANPALGCTSGQVLCAIYAVAVEETGKPAGTSISSTSNIFEYISQARFLGGFPYPTALPFVYLRANT